MSNCFVKKNETDDVGDSMKKLFFIFQILVGDGIEEHEQEDIPEDGECLNFFSEF
jgi:hypothetical protein